MNRFTALWLATATLLCHPAAVAQVEPIIPPLVAPTAPTAPTAAVRHAALRVVKPSLLEQIMPCHESKPDGRNSYATPSEFSQATREQISALLKASNPDQRDLGAAMSAYVDGMGAPRSQLALFALSSSQQNAFAALMLQHLSATRYTLLPGVTVDQHAATDAVTKLEAMTRTKGWPGEAVALSWMANVYLNGLGGKKADEYAAFKFMDRAMQNRYTPAVTVVAIMYANGQGIFPDKAKAFQLFQLAAAAGDEYARLAAADALVAGDGVPKNVGEAMKLYQQGASANYTHSLERLGWIYRLGLEGSGVRPSFEQSETYFKEAIKAGSDTASVALAQIYLQEAASVRDGKRRESLTSSAEKLISDAVQVGNSDAMVMRGDQLIAAGKVQDAYNEYERAAKLGDPNGAFNAGFLLERYGDKKIGAMYYEQAVKARVPAAMYHLGLLLSEGDGIPKDTVRAVKLYESAALAGHTCAMVSLANALGEGEGIAQDERAAYNLFQKAAALGNNTAMMNRARWLYIGRGTAVNKVESKKWYLRAIEAGETRAYPEYGRILLEEGDAHQALEIFRTCSTAKAEANCDLYLGLMLLDGKAAPQDEAAATRHFDQYVTAVGSVCGAARVGNAYKERENYPQAIAWYKRGITGGCTLSMFAYAEMLYEGKVVPKDVQAARHLMKQASEKEMKAATDWLARHP